VQIQIQDLVCEQVHEYLHVSINAHLHTMKQSNVFKTLE